MHFTQQEAFFNAERVAATKRVSFLIGSKAGAPDWALSVAPQVYLVGMFNEVFNNLTSLRVQLQYATDSGDKNDPSASATWRTLIDTGTLAKADTTPRVLWNRPFPTAPAMKDAKHISCVVTIAGTAPTTGRVTVLYKPDPFDERGVFDEVFGDSTDPIPAYTAPTGFSMFPGENR